MSFSCGWFVLSGIGLCVGLITRPRESYRVWCLSVIANPGYRGGLGQLGAVETRREIYAARYYVTGGW
jgi:hypothetical protein